jgi:anti-sigma factor RsiW
MSCQQFQSQLHAYHDGELDAAAVQQLESHLAQCASCAAELRSLRAMSHLMRQSIPMAEISADALARLHAEVDHTMDSSLLPLARSFVGIAAVILIAATAGLWLMRPLHASAPQSWEGAMLTPQNNEFASQTASGSGSTIEQELPELIVADLSRSNHR